MRATSYETTLAYIEAMNRKSRRPNMLQRATWLLGMVREGIRNAAAYEEMTRKGVSPENAVRRVFESMKR